MDEKIRIADAAAGAAMLIGLDPEAPLPLMPDVLAQGKAMVMDNDLWPLITSWPRDANGAPLDNSDQLVELIFGHLGTLADFVRAYPDAPLEAMYRHAAGQGIHARPADGFDDIEPAFRIAYEVFRSTLLTADRVFADEEARAAAKARAAAAQAPVIVPVEDTILAQHGGIMERIGDRPDMVNLGGPVVAASTEGEGGDGSAEMGAAAGSAAVDHGSPAAVAGDVGMAQPVADAAAAADGGAADPAAVGEAVSDGSTSAGEAAAAGPVSGDGGQAGPAVDAAGGEAQATAVADAADPAAQPTDAAPLGPDGQPDSPGTPPEAPVKPRRK